MVLLCHLPTSCMMLVSTRVRISTMVPPAQREQALTLTSVDTTSRLAARTIAWMAAVISYLWMMWFLPLSNTAVRGVSLGALLWWRCATWRCNLATGHACRWPVRPWPINSSLTPFFCVVKNRLKLGFVKGGGGSRQWRHCGIERQRRIARRPGWSSKGGYLSLLCSILLVGGGKRTHSRQGCRVIVAWGCHPGRMRWGRRECWWEGYVLKKADDLPSVGIYLASQEKVNLPQPVLP